MIYYDTKNLLNSIDNFRVLSPLACNLVKLPKWVIRLAGLLGWLTCLMLE